MSNDDQMLVPSLSRSMSPMSIAIQSADFNRSRDVSHQKHALQPVASMRKQALLAHARSNSIDLNDHDFELILPKAVRNQSLLSRKSPFASSPSKPSGHLMQKNHASPLSTSFCASFYSPSSSSAAKSEPFAENPIEKELFKEEQHVQRQYVRQGNVFLCLEHVENHSPNMPKSFHSLSKSENVVGRPRAGDTDCDTDHSYCVSFWPPVSPTDITFHDVHSPQGILKKQYKKRFFEESGFDDTCALNSDRDTQEGANDTW